jgi:SAM-dependent methyltransferase
VDCPLGCGPLAPDETPLRDNRIGLPHVVHVGWCTQCGLGVTLDPPSQPELDELYRRCYVGDGERRVPRTGLAARLWHVLNGSLPLTDLVRSGPVLDVGCNTGEALVALRSRGLEVMGLEPNPEAAAVARSYGLEIVQAPIEEAEIPPAHFAAILLSQVLEHVRDPHLVLRNVRDALRPEGVVYLVVPNSKSLWRRVFGPDWVHWHVPFHLYHYTEQALERLCLQCGLELRTIRNVTSGEWLLQSIAARRNARRGRFELEGFSGRYGRRLLVAPAGRIADLLHRGDALVAEAVALTASSRGAASPPSGAGGGGLPAAGRRTC